MTGDACAATIAGAIRRGLVAEGAVPPSTASVSERAAGRRRGPRPG